MCMSQVIYMCTSTARRSFVHSCAVASTPALAKCFMPAICVHQDTIYAPCQQSPPACQSSVQLRLREANTGRLASSGTAWAHRSEIITHEALTLHRGSAEAVKT